MGFQDFFFQKKIYNFTFIWPCIVINFFIIKPNRCTNFKNLFWHETLHVSDSSSVHHQEFIHCALSNGICHTGLGRSVESGSNMAASRQHNCGVFQWVFQWRHGERDITEISLYQTTVVLAPPLFLPLPQERDITEILSNPLFLPTSYQFPSS